MNAPTRPPPLPLADRIRKKTDPARLAEEARTKSDGTLYKRPKSGRTATVRALLRRLTRRGYRLVRPHREAAGRYEVIVTPPGEVVGARVDVEALISACADVPASSVRWMASVFVTLSDRSPDPKPLDGYVTADGYFAHSVGRGNPDPFWHGVAVGVTLDDLGVTPSNDETPNFDKVCNHLFGDGELRDFALMRMGQIIQAPRTALLARGSLLLIGPHANGKSQWLGAVAGLLPVHRRATVHPSNFDTDKHASAALDGARIWYVPDLTGLPGKSGVADLLSLLSGDEGVSVNPKHKPQKPITPAAPLIAAMNTYPRTDRPEIMDRLTIIPTVGDTIPREKRDTRLGDKLRQERPGILWKLLDHAGGDVPRPAEVARAMEDWSNALDPVAAWARARLEERKGGRVGSTEAYRDFCDWTADKRLRGMSQRAFSIALKERGVRSGKVKGRMRFKDVELSPDGWALEDR